VVIQVPQALQNQLAILVQQGLQAHQVLQGQQAIPPQVVFQVQQALLDQPAILVQQDLQALQLIQVQPVI
jgi:hypothetical protein